MGFDIAIAGAGIGGLTAAALFAAEGHRVTVFDQFDRPQPVGSGLVIQPVGQGVLAQIAALPASLNHGQPIKRMLGHDSGRAVLDVLYDRGDGRFGLAIHRAALFDAVYQAALAAGAVIVPNARVTGRQGQRLKFGSRTEGPFDLIVDATGAGSVLSPLKARRLGYGAIWGTVDWPKTELPETELRQRYRGAAKMAGVLPCGRLPGEDQRKAAIFWSLPAEEAENFAEADLGAWKAEVAALWPEAMGFFGQITDPSQLTPAVYAHGTLRRPYDQGLAIIGDAAHRASPQLGQGANMALLDALALARAVEEFGVRDGLPAYAMARRWHVRVYQLMSAVFTPQYQSASRIQPWLRDRIFFPASRVPPIPRLLTAIVCGTMIPPLGSLSR